MQPRAEDSELQTRTMRKVAVRFIPVPLGLYIIAARSSTRWEASATSARAS
jgi:hypothetical protein